MKVYFPENACMRVACVPSTRPKDASGSWSLVLSTGHATNAEINELKNENQRLI